MHRSAELRLHGGHILPECLIRLSRAMHQNEFIDSRTGLQEPAHRFDEIHFCRHAADIRWKLQGLGCRRVHIVKQDGGVRHNIGAFCQPKFQRVRIADNHRIYRLAAIFHAVEIEKRLLIGGIRKTVEVEVFVMDIHAQVGSLLKFLLHGLNCQDVDG